MVVRNAKDFWAGLMFMAFGLAFMVIAKGTPDFINELFGTKVIPGYQMGSAVRMGPAYFPVLLGGMLAALGAVIFLRSFVSKLIGKASEARLPFNLFDLLVAVGVFVLATYLAKWLKISHDWAMLGSALVIAVLAIVFRPEAKAITLVLVSSLAFAYLLKPLGLVLASVILIFISAFGGHEFKWKEVAVLAAILVLFSVLVFVKALALPFPVCPNIIDNCPIR
jgi:putative tricarboxylic transport membrane protein